MQNTFKRVCVACTLLSFFLVNFNPLAVEAKVAKKKIHPKLSVSAVRGKDEKNFQNPTSRCLTKDMVALNNKAVKQMGANIAKAGEGHDAAVKRYNGKLTMVWSAMAEPYCGYGSRGKAAVKKSFIKSIERAHAEFIGAVKKPKN